MALMHCPQCGKPNLSDRWEECPRCGYRIQARPFTRCEVGGAVEFGAFKWHVIDRRKDKALLLADEAVDWRALHSRYSTAKWEDSELREWLSTDFITQYFSAEERDRIVPYDTVSSRTQYKDFFESSVRDKAFCISVGELQNIRDKSIRRCKASDRARAYGASTDEFGYCNWWLRTYDEDDYSACYVTQKGEHVNRAFEHFHALSTRHLGVRPALWIRL